MQTVLMKLTCAILVGGEVVRPPAIIECSPEEAADYARRGKAVAATEHDAPTATTPNAVASKDAVSVDSGGDTIPPVDDVEKTDDAPTATTHKKKAR